MTANKTHGPGGPQRGVPVRMQESEIVEPQATGHVQEPSVSSPPLSQPRQRLNVVDVPMDPAPPTRRHIVRLLAAAPLAAFAISCEAVERATELAADVMQQAAQRWIGFTPKFYTADEFHLVRVLADLIIPKDERSGSASDAGVPEFLDFLMIAYPDMQKPMRDGLEWMNAASRLRFSNALVSATPTEQVALLDDVAFPKRAEASMKEGVTFFSRFRDLTASGFWSSRVGIADLQYQGNTAQAVWNGCPPAALAKLGVEYS